MTTSTADAPRDINELLDLPYSEMTEQEIELVIQFKADVQTRDALHNETMKKLDAHLQDVAQQNRRAADAAIERLNELTAHALERFKDASNG